MGFLFCFLTFILKGLFASIVSHISQNGTEKLTTIWVEKRGVQQVLAAIVFIVELEKLTAQWGEKYQNYSNLKKGNSFCLLIIHHIFHLFLKMNYKQKKVLAFLPHCAILNGSFFLEKGTIFSVLPWKVRAFLCSLFFFGFCRYFCLVWFQINFWVFFLEPQYLDGS